MSASPVFAPFSLSLPFVKKCLFDTLPSPSLPREQEEEEVCAGEIFYTCERERGTKKREGWSYSCLQGLFGRLNGHTHLTPTTIWLCVLQWNKDTRARGKVEIVAYRIGRFVPKLDLALQMLSSLPPFEFGLFEMCLGP